MTEAAKERRAKKGRRERKERKGKRRSSREHNDMSVDLFIILRYFFW